MIEKVELVQKEVQKVLDSQGFRPLRNALVGALLLGAMAAAPAFADVQFPNSGCTLRGDAGTIYLAIPGIVGNCIQEPQNIDNNGDTEQKTAGGDFFMLNGRVAFTNGNTTWEVVPFNFQFGGFGPGSVVSRINGGQFPWEVNGNVIVQPNPNQQVIVTQPGVVNNGSNSMVISQSQSQSQSIVINR